MQESHQVRERSRWGPESPVPGAAKKESTEIRSRWGTKSPGLGEAKMGTRFTRSRLFPGVDQSYQFRVRTR